MPFLSSPGPHEDLHSFPTRRSSDLNAGLDPNTVLQSISVGAAGSWSMSNYGPRMIQRDFAPGFAIKHYIKDIDPKSTRLNSSHVAISYAVFCLKKKSRSI